MKRSIHIVLILFLLPSLTAFGQSKILENYIAEGLKANLQLQQQGLQTQWQEQVLNEAKGKKLPTFSFIANYTRAGGGRTIAFPVGDLLNPVYATLNNMIGSDQFPQIENVNEQFLPNDFHETKFRLIQPLYRPEIGYNQNAQSYLLEVQKLSQKTIEQKLREEISVAYYQFLQTIEAEEIFQSNRNLLNEILRVNKKLVGQQKATKEIIYDIEYELQEIEAQEAINLKNKQMAISYFNFLLNRELNEEIKVDEGILSQNANNVSTLTNYYESAQQRSETQQLELSLKAQEEVIKIEKANFLPKVDAVLDAGYQGFGYNFDSNQDFWLAQVSLSYPIFQGFGRKSKLQQAKLQTEKLNTQLKEVRKQLSLETHAAYYDFQSSLAQLNSKRKAEKSAKESFRIAQRKYDEQLIPFYEWTEYRTRLQNAQLASNISKYETFIKEIQLKHAAGLF